MECGRSVHFIGKHVVSHGISQKEYYDKWLKKDGEGICPVCGAETAFDRISHGYAAYCCFEHFKKSELVKEHRRITNLKLYNVENCFQSVEKMEKSTQTKLERYNDPKYNNRKQIIKTCLEKYGVENPGGLPESIRKANETYLMHFGCHPSQVPEIRAKIGTRYKYDGIKFDSSYEIAFYIWHKEHGSNISRCTDYFSYKCGNKTHRYFPDFKIDDTYYEIKGKHLLSDDRTKLIDPKLKITTEKDIAKMNCIIKNNVKLLSNEDIKPYLKYVSDKYGRNYIKGFKNQVFT